MSNITSNRLNHAITIGIVTNNLDETQSIGMVQMCTHNGAFSQDQIPHMQLYGFHSSPLPGCDLAIVSAEGRRSKAMIVGSNDQRFRPKNTNPGEVKVYDNAGQFIYLANGTAINITANQQVLITVGNTTVQVTQTGVTVNTTNINFTASTGMTITTPTLDLNVTTINSAGHGGGSTTANITGSIISTGDQVANGISQTGHVHTGVQTGSGNTGLPTG